MAKTTLLFFLSLCAPLAAQELSTASMRAIRLGEAYNLSVARSEVLAQQDAGIKQLESAERLISASFRPSLDFTASQDKQQNSASATKGYFSAGYRLFSGMRDYIAAKAAAARTGISWANSARKLRSAWPIPARSLTRTRTTSPACRRSWWCRTATRPPPAASTWP